MGIISTVKAHFLHLAIRSSSSPPIFTDNEKLVAARSAEDAKGNKIIQQSFENLVRRLGDSWQLFTAPSGIIAFRKTDFTSGDGAFTYAMDNQHSLQWVEWDLSEVGRVKNFGQVVHRKRLKDIPTNEVTCSICGDDVSRRTFVTGLGCTHWFHEMCIEDWARVDERCPICRRNIVESFTSTPG